MESEQEPPAGKITIPSRSKGFLIDDDGPIGFKGALGSR